MTLDTVTSGEGTKNRKGHTPESEPRATVGRNAQSGTGSLPVLPGAHRTPHTPWAETRTGPSGPPRYSAPDTRGRKTKLRSHRNPQWL